MSIAPTSRPPTGHGVARWEVGGEFDRREVPDGTFVAWPAPNRLYGLAQHALMAMWRVLPPVATPRTLHVPDYFCPEVVVAWRGAGIAVSEYPDDPRWFEPDWAGLRPEPDDVVLAVNFFGVRDDAGWRRWRLREPGLLLVEDHSHDPASRWARRSIADYAFASLRKTFPVSDGAILWSPRGASLPGPPAEGLGAGGDLKREAMALKRVYLDGAAVDKDVYRELQLRGERELLASPLSAITSWSRRAVERGQPTSWRDRRRRNVGRLLGLIDGASAFRPLFGAWPAGHCPFNVVLLFPEERSRDACRAQLIAAGIYPPVHWPQPPDAGPRVRELASLILTIPVDQRYGAADVRQVAAVLLAFDRSPAATH